MPWTDKYWDAIHDLYWFPRYLGLKSIPQKLWTKTETTVTIPRTLTNPSGPLYRRIQSGAEYQTYVRRQEEIFNHIWNIALAVLPGDVVADLFNPLLGWQSDCDYSSHKGTTGDRYKSLSDGNVTSPDCLLLSERAVLAIEIKFNARTSLDQIAKYLSVLVAEEELGGVRGRLGLLYVYPTDAHRRFTREVGQAPAAIASMALDKIEAATEHPVVRKYMKENRERFKSALERLTVACITWNDVSSCINEYVRELGNEKGDRTLSRVLSGLESEVRSHPLSAVEA